MEIPFVFDGEHGRVLAQVVANTDPVSVGKSECERGMPVCTASVEFSARGYRLQTVVADRGTTPVADAAARTHRLERASRLSGREIPTWAFGEGR